MRRVVFVTVFLVGVLGAAAGCGRAVPSPTVPGTTAPGTTPAGPGPG
jgi:hypothetical protein